MASNPGIWAANLAPLAQVQDAYDGLVPFVIGATTTVTSGTRSIHNGQSPHRYAIMSVAGVTTVAGAAGMTVRLWKRSGGVSYAITEAINTSALANNATFMAQTLNQLYTVIDKFNDDLWLISTGNANASLAIICIRAVL